MTKSMHLKFHFGCVINNGVMSSNYGAMTEPRASLWLAGTWLCCWVRAGIKVSSHDPLWNYTDELFSHGLFPWLSLLILSEDPHILSEDPYIGPKVVKLPSEVAKKITFEE